MGISKLDSYLKILKTLMDNSLTTDMLSFVINMDCVALRQHLDFLMMNGLIEERITRKKKMYTLSVKGIAVLRVLGSKEYFDKIRDPLADINQTVQLREVSEKEHE